MNVVRFASDRFFLAPQPRNGRLVRFNGRHTCPIRELPNGTGNKETASMFLLDEQHTL